jgi:tetratricopeptide (TPR) repeat protein
MPPSERDGAAPYRAELARLERLLSQEDVSAVDLESSKLQIATVYRALERDLAELGALKERVKELAARWKELERRAAEQAKSPVRSRRSDHLNASSFVEKAWNALARGDHREAEEALRRAIELVPDDNQAGTLLGWSLILQGRLDEALMELQQVLARDPGNALARVNLGFVCLRKGIYGEAIEHLTRTIRENRDRRATLYANYYLGLAYLERDMYADAQAFFEAAVSLGPSMAEAYYQLGRARSLAGDVPGACRAWRAGATANKFSPWSRRCREALAAAEGGSAGF